MANRTAILPALWADNGTAVPDTPVQGSTYRGATANDIKNGWPFRVIADAAVANEFLHTVSVLLAQLSNQGLLSWCPTEDYLPGSVVMGSNGGIYTALLPSTNIDPTTDTNHWTPLNAYNAGLLGGQPPSYYAVAQREWQDHTSSRTPGTVYQNIAPHPIQVVVTCSSGSSSNTTTMYVGSAANTLLAIAATGNSYSGGACEGVISVEVPPGHYYKVTSGGIASWCELS